MCVHTPMYVAALWVWVSCWPACTYMSHAWVFLHPCVCVWLSLRLCVCQASPTSLGWAPASESLSMLELMTAVPRGMCGMVSGTEYMLPGMALLFTLTQRVCVH